MTTSELSSQRDAGSVEQRLAISAVVVTRDSAADVGRSLPSVRQQLRPGDELVVVDNASRDGTPDAARAAVPDALVIETGANLGFAGGCNLGARASRGRLLLFLNPDAVLADGSLAALRQAAAEHPRWGAWQPLVLLPGGARINTSGGVTHFLGFGWAGQCDAAASDAARAEGTASFASGAALVVRREAWQRLAGFDESYFMYAEDLDFGLRLWLSGWEVGVVPAAIVEHDYEFDKGGYKWFLLERNRWYTIVGDYPAALLALVLPALLAFELALLPVAAAGGWLSHKLRAQLCVLRNLPRMLARRRRVQSQRVLSAAEFASLLTSSLDSPYLAAADRLPYAASLQASYWSLVRHALGC